MKDTGPIPSEILFLKEKINSLGGHVFFDVDGTIKGANTPETPAGFCPKLPELLEKLGRVRGLSVGACTSQSPQELHSYLLKMSPNGGLMDGLSILEDGHILVMSGQHMVTGAVELISPEAKAQIAALKIELKKAWALAQGPDLMAGGWGFFPGVATPVILPEGKYQGSVTVSVWENGPDIHDSSYQGQYESVALFASQLAKNMGFELIEFREAGNGTLRVLERGKSKESALVMLDSKGLINLKNTVYVGDGLNDVESAKLVFGAGGGVIVVANAISELKKLATYVCKKQASHGVVEALSLILSN